MANTPNKFPNISGSISSRPNLSGTVSASGGALAFDLLDVFVKEHVMKNGIPYLHYYFPDPLVVSEITFNFFWKD